MAPGRQRQTRTGLGLGLLAAQIMQIGVDKIPPVTLITVIVNVVIFMKLIPALPTVHFACTSNKEVFRNGQWQRLVLSSFYHLDDMHLYFNMVSFIWKGMILEKKLKSRKFFMVICLFSILTQLVMLGLNKVFSMVFLNEKYLYTCAAGFSAVIFALKVLTTVSSDDNVSVMGIPIKVPSRYACWVELVIIQILVPNASFTGHLAGILVGLLYTLGPLKKVLNVFDNIFEAPSLQRDRTSYQFQSGTTGSNNHPQSSSQRRYSDNSADEELQRAIRESLRDKGRFPSSQQDRYSHPPQQMHQPYGWNIGDNQSSSGGAPYPDSRLYQGSPPYPQGRSDNLYPDLSSYRTDDTAYKGSSAPPAEFANSHSSELPYPPSDTWQSTYQSEHIAPRPSISRSDRVTSPGSHDSPLDQHRNTDELRARLRRFDQS